MKKIFIASHCMELGGAERALISLLHFIDYSKYSVDLLLYRKTGELLKDIPQEVNLLPVDEDMSMLAVPMATVIRNRRWKMLYGRLLSKFKSRQFLKRTTTGNGESMVELLCSHKYTVRYAKKNTKEHYDMAISFLTPHYYVADKVDADIKLAWIHTDYRNYILDIDSELEMWSKYNYIVSISEQCTQGFLEVFPSLREKLIKIENMLLTEYVHKQSEMECEDLEMMNPRCKDEVILCSVGRYTNAKNFDNVPAICKRITELGYKIRWFIIGYGGEEDKIKTSIIENNMEDRVILLGKKENPYPYIKKADIYVQPSRYEGKAVTVIEAQILGKPVIITQYPSSGSQLEDGVDGVIVPLDNEKCAEAIVKIIRNKEMLDQLSRTCKERDYSNKQEIEKLYKLMEV